MQALCHWATLRAPVFIYYLFIYLVELGFELWASCLQQALYWLRHTSISVCLFWRWGYCELFVWSNLEPQSSQSQPSK
jgi:hypothetical protein